MNYFKGNGACGISTSPKHIKAKGSATKLILNPNAVINNGSAKSQINKMDRHISNIFTD